jgi:hypothetical protein
MPSSGMWHQGVWHHIFVLYITVSFDIVFSSQVKSHFTTDGRSVSMSWYWAHSGTYFLSEGFCLKFAVLFLWDALSDERTGLQFAVQSLNGPSRAEPVTILYCLIWDSSNLESGPVIPPGIGFSLGRLLRLAGLPWRYSNAPSHGEIYRFLSDIFALFSVTVCTFTTELCNWFCRF